MAFSPSLTGLGIADCSLASGCINGPLLYCLYQAEARDNLTVGQPYLQSAVAA